MAKLRATSYRIRSSDRRSTIEFRGDNRSSEIEVETIWLMGLESAIPLTRNRTSGLLQLGGPESPSVRRIFRKHDGGLIAYREHNRGF
jgi:hypothetical protein